MKRPAACAFLALAIASCTSPEKPPAVAPAPIPPAPPSSAPPSSRPPSFAAEIATPTRARLARSWRPGCPVPVKKLRLITLTYWGFDGRPHTGELVVRRDVADDIVTIFKRLYGWRWPIKRMKPVDAYRGDDFDSIEADNTSAFNCRPATGSSSWSKHAYGLAVDVNPRENPYVTAGGGIAHKNATKFKARPVDSSGVINPGDRVVRAFERLGWEWGGYWSGTKDYQHFSKGGG